MQGLQGIARMLRIWNIFAGVALAAKWYLI